MEKTFIYQPKTKRNANFIRISFLTIAVLLLQFFVPLTLDAVTSPTLVPTGVGNYSDWTGNPTNTAAGKVSAVASNDGDTSYLSATTNSSRQSFTLPGAAVPAGSIINSVTLNVMAKYSGGSTSIQLFAENGTGSSNRSTDSAHTLTGSYASYSRVMTTNPFTATAWTVSEVNSWTTRFGVVKSSTAYTARVTQISVVVDYTAPVLPAPNPALAQSCGIDMVLVIDTSTSIDNTELGQMRSAFVSFVNTMLPATPANIAVVSFDDSAVLQQSFTNNITTLTTKINSTDGDGYTNWEAALLLARNQFTADGKPHLIVFSSDGNPTASSAGPNDTSQPNAHLVPAILQANLAKAAGIRIVTLGIGGELSTANLQAISSADAVYTSANFNTLTTALHDLATDLCGGTINIHKIIDQDGNIQTTQDQTAGVGWNFTVTNSSVIDTPVTGANGYTPSVNVKTEQGPFSVSETSLPSGYSLITASCTGSSGSNGTLNGTTISGIAVSNGDIVACTFYNIELECVTDADCDNGLYCDGQETCVQNVCLPGTPVSCSVNDIYGIGSCGSDPDNNPATYDFRNPFISQCDETTDSCTAGDLTITHDCSVADCQAQCDEQYACADTICHTQNGCVGNDYYTYLDIANNCQSDCACSHNACTAPTISYNDPACTECQANNDCTKLNQTYCDGTVIKHDQGVCVEFSCQAQTSIIQDCNDGLACDGLETCSQGACLTGTAVVCSNYDLSGIASCTNDPDNNPYTYDYRLAYASVCQEPSGTCSTGDESITHNCSTDCGGCVIDANCDDQNPHTADTCDTYGCQCQHTALPYCGDGIKNNDEQCDGSDGVTEHYSCTDQCSLEYLPYCGDSIVNNGETCDNGVGNGQVCTAGYGQTCHYCTGNCTDASITGPHCGDSIKNGEEQCDGQDGLVEHQSCSAQCTLVNLQYCGDGSCNNQENCSSCSQDCGQCGGGGGICGNGLTEGQEACDNGTTNGQVCTAAYGQTCQYCTTDCTMATVSGPHCGDGSCNGDETCSTCSQDCGSCGGNNPEPPIPFSIIPLPIPTVEQPQVLAAVGAPDLTITKNIEKDFVNPGDKNIAVTITVTNSGNLTAYNTVLHDSLIDGISYSPDSPASGFASTDLDLTHRNWTLGDLNPGKIVTINYLVNLASDIEPSIYINRAVTQADNNGPVNAADQVEVRQVKTLGMELAPTGFEPVELIGLIALLGLILYAILILKRKYQF